MLNSPHLEAAVILDEALRDFSSQIDSLGFANPIASGDELTKIMDYIKNTVLPELKLWQFYVIDVAAEKAKFTKAWQTKQVAQSASADLSAMSREDLVQYFADQALNQNWSGLAGRYSASIANMNKAVAIVAKLLNDPAASEHDAGQTLEGLLNDLNVNRYKLFNEDVTAILDNTRGRIEYTRLANHGPQMGKITSKCVIFRLYAAFSSHLCDCRAPLVEPLFTRLPKNTRTSKHDPRSLSLANNGWIWNANALEDFASPPSRAYVRREVIVWGDCVKLRYGKGPEDNPFLWQHMTKYTELLAGMFDGFRIDNCHSTPIHVGEQLLDAARRVNPNLYICAELFTGSEDTDVHFVRQLGLSSLIREAMNGNDPKDMSRLLYNYGVGKPVGGYHAPHGSAQDSSVAIGSMDSDCLTEESSFEHKGVTRACNIVPLQGSAPHAFMMDCTHDNESPADKRTARDALPTGGLVTFCWSAIGSNKGFDDLYPKLLNLVTDTRHYETYENPNASGIGKFKRIMNHLHTEMAIEGFSEGHLHQEADVRICLTLVDPC